MNLYNRLALVALLLSCGGSPLVPPGPPLPSDADAIVQCDAICSRLTLLHCDGWQGNEGPDEVWETVDDVPCDLVCVEIQQTVALNANCTLAAGSCEAVDECEVE